MRSPLLIVLMLFLAVAPASADGPEPPPTFCHCNTPDRVYEKYKDGRCFLRSCESGDEFGPRCTPTREFFGIWSARLVDPKECDAKKSKDPVRLKK